MMKLSRVSGVSPSAATLIARNSKTTLVVVFEFDGGATNRRAWRGRTSDAHKLGIGRLGASYANARSSCSICCMRLCKDDGVFRVHYAHQECDIPDLMKVSECRIEACTTYFN